MTGVAPTEVIASAAALRSSCIPAMTLETKTRLSAAQAEISAGGGRSGPARSMKYATLGFNA